MLIASPRYTADDLRHWAGLEAMDRIYARTHERRLHAAADRAIRHMLAFLDAGPCYAGTSWGKDSLVIAHLASRIYVERRITIPLVHFNIVPVANPDCALVRDAFLDRFHVEYHDMVAGCPRQADGTWAMTGRDAPAIALTTAKLGTARYISGVRGQESGARTRRMSGHGIATKNTCAPIGWWTVRDVFAYLSLYDLPIHPAYACSHGGRWDRDRLRVATLAGDHGTMFGAREKEMRYYREELRALGLDKVV